MKPSETITVLREVEKPIDINAIVFDTETKTYCSKCGYDLFQIEIHKCLNKKHKFWGKLKLESRTCNWCNGKGVIKVKGKCLRCGNREKELKLRFGYYKKIIRGKETRDNDFFFQKEPFTQHIIDSVGFPNDNKNKFVWAHNASFDFRIGISTKVLKDNGYTIGCFSANPFIIEYVNEESSIIFLDTFNFFKTSIEKLGKYFGIEKIQIDFEDEANIDLVQLRERCKRDVEVCLKVLENLYPQMGGRVKVSAAQMAFHAVRQCLPFDIQRINTDLSDLSYHGGRVEVFRNDKAYTKKFDVNSEYPYVMKKYEYPVGLEGFYLYPTKKFMQLQIEKGLGFIADCNFNIPENIHVPSIPLIRDKDLKLIFPVGKFRSIVCQPEINFDYVTSINSVEFYYMGKIFEKFIDTYYPLKQASEGFMREFYKVGRLNSSYGKFAQKRIRTERFKKYDNLLNFGSTRLTDLKNETYNMKFMDGECFVNIPGDRKFSVAVASFVCSYARADLYNRTMQYLNHVKDLYYFDTDCFVLPESYNLPTNDELGGIKLEDEGVSQFFCPKIYYYEHDNERKMKLKGVKKSWVMEWKEDMITAKGKRFTNFSETLNKNMIGVLEIEQEKKISLKDDKRSWQLNNSISKPIVLS